MMPSYNYSAYHHGGEDDDDGGGGAGGGGGGGGGQQTMLMVDYSATAASHEAQQQRTTTTTTTAAEAVTTKLPTSKRKRGSGMMVLRHELGSNNSSDAAETGSGGLLSSQNAKSILRDLLRENEVDIPNIDENNGGDDVVEVSITAIAKKKKRKPIETSMSDERVMQLAQEGELSFLASILKVMEEEGSGDSILTTKFLIKACCLAVEPARVPAWCDAKEMVMAALYYLSREIELEQEDEDDDDDDQKTKKVFPPLPLVRPVQETNDLEKRSYERVGNWSIVDDPTLLEQVLTFEQVFYDGLLKQPLVGTDGSSSSNSNSSSSGRNNKWLAREHACPHLPSGRDLLLLKGSPPAYCTGKKAKGGATGASASSTTGQPRGRKASTSTTGKSASTSSPSSSAALAAATAAAASASAASTMEQN